jgi:Tol biopolymer transport system component/DNA-binding winged helix-turn-helix (wHTH) protein
MQKRDTPADPSAGIIRFGAFEVDLQTGELKRRGLRVKLQEQPFQVLVALLERPGKLVTRDELRERLWPSDTFVDFDHSLNATIKRLRDALDESAQAPIFIETMARRGYRFVAPVQGHFVESEGGSSRPRRFGLSLSRVAGAGALLFLTIVLVSWTVWRYSRRSSNVIETRLTTNSAESSVTGAAISPDGRYLAYSDRTGVYLKLTRSDETRAVRLPPDFSARVDDWFPDGSHLLVSRTEGPGTASLWSISIFGGAPRQLASDAIGGSVSPDGARIAFLRGDLSYVGLLAREQWVMNSDGTNAVKIAADRADGSWVAPPTWSPDGKHLAYVRTIWSFDAPKSSVEINEWEKKTEETLFSNDRLDLALHWLPDGRLIYALSSLQPMQDSSLWVMPVRKEKGTSPAAKQIAGENGWIPRMGGRADGKALVFVRGNRSPSVYIGTLSGDGMQLVSHKRLTLDETMNLPFSWTPDSKAVFFNSTRSGVPVIFKQAIDEALADVLVRSKDQVSQPRLAPDGTEIVYISTPKSGGAGAHSSIFAVSINGGVPRLVLKDTDIYAVECAKAPSTTCAYSVKKGGNLETFRFDVKSGKRSDGPQIDPYCSWSLSPDGSQRAVVVYGSNVSTIQLRSITTGKSRELVLKGWEGLKNIDWSADGKSLFVVWHDFQRDSALLNVSLDGKVLVLARSSNPEVFWAIPSPNGRLLAIAEAQSTQNVWQIENF